MEMKANNSIETKDPSLYEEEPDTDDSDDSSSSGDNSDDSSSSGSSTSSDDDENNDNQQGPSKRLKNNDEEDKKNNISQAVVVTTTSTATAATEAATSAAVSTTTTDDAAAVTAYQAVSLTDSSSHEQEEENDDEKKAEELRKQKEKKKETKKRKQATLNHKRVLNMIEAMPVILTGVPKANIPIVGINGINLHATILLDKPLKPDKQAVQLVLSSDETLQTMFFNKLSVVPGFDDMKNTEERRNWLIQNSEYRGTTRKDQGNIGDNCNIRLTSFGASKNNHFLNNCNVRDSWLSNDAYISQKEFFNRIEVYNNNDKRIKEPSTLSYNNWCISVKPDPKSDTFDGRGSLLNMMTGTHHAEHPPVDAQGVYSFEKDNKTEQRPSNYKQTSMFVRINDDLTVWCQKNTERTKTFKTFRKKLGVNKKLLILIKRLSTYTLISLLQKIIRSRAIKIGVPVINEDMDVVDSTKNDKLYSSIDVLKATIVALAESTPTFIHNLQISVPGLTNLCKRLLVIFFEDATVYANDIEKRLLSLMATSHVASRVLDWTPNVDCLLSIAELAVAMLKSKKVVAVPKTTFKDVFLPKFIEEYDSDDTSSSNDNDENSDDNSDDDSDVYRDGMKARARKAFKKYQISLTSDNHHQLEYVSPLLNMLGSFPYDMEMVLAVVRHRETLPPPLASPTEEVHKNDLIPIYHCIDHHCAPNFVYLMHDLEHVQESSEPSKPFSFFFSRVFDELTGINPRRGDYINEKDAFIRAVRTAQRNMFTHMLIGSEYSNKQIEKLEKKEKVALQYVYDFDYIYGMIGHVELVDYRGTKYFGVVSKKINDDAEDAKDQEEHDEPMTDDDDSDDDDDCDNNNSQQQQHQQQQGDNDETKKKNKKKKRSLFDGVKFNFVVQPGSRVKNTSISDDTRRYLIGQMKRKLLSGVPVTGCSPPATVFVDKRTLIRITKGGKFNINDDDWEELRKVKTNVEILPVVKSKHLNINRAIRSIHYQSYATATDDIKNVITSLLEKETLESLRRIMTLVKGYPSEIVFPNVSITGGSIDKELPKMIDTEVFDFFCKLSIHVPSALMLDRLNVRKFNVISPAILYFLRDKIFKKVISKRIKRQAMEIAEGEGKNNNQQTDNRTWLNDGHDQVYIYDDEMERTLFPSQQAGVETLINRHLNGETASGVFTSTGSGKTLMALTYLKYLADNNELPKHVFWLAPSGSFDNAVIELKQFFSIINILYSQKTLPKRAAHHDTDIVDVIRSVNGILPFCITIIDHDRVRIDIDELVDIAQDAMTVVDEFHLLLEGTAQKSQAAYKLAANSKNVLILSATPTTSSNIYKITPWLNMLSNFPITRNNIFTGLTNAYSQIISTDIPVEDVEDIATIPESLMDQFMSLAPFPLGGKNANATVEDMNELKVLAYKIITNRMVELTVERINQGHKVFLVSRNSVHQGIIEQKLKQRGIDNIFCFSRQTPITLTPAMLKSKECKDYDVVIGLHSIAEGYTLTTLDTMITSVYPSNAATRLQLRGRINRLGSKAKQLTYYNVCIASFAKLLSSHNVDDAFLESVQRI